MKTPYRILIDVGGKDTPLERIDSHTAVSYLTKEQYESQLRRSDDRWICTKTGRSDGSMMSGTKRDSLLGWMK